MDYVAYEDEKEYIQDGVWEDVTGMFVNLSHSGKKLIICSLSIGTDSHVNVGFRFMDDNGILYPIRAKTNDREPAHFSVEPSPSSDENLTVWTLQMIADCSVKLKLQMIVDDKGRVRVNSMHKPFDGKYNHKPISTLTALSLSDAPTMSISNPYVQKLDCVYVAYAGEKNYDQASWVDVTGMSVDLNCSGKKLIICSICINAKGHVNVGLRFLDANDVLKPFRKKTNNREPAHFSIEPNPNSFENLTTYTFHMVADCKGKVKLQMRVDDSGNVMMNGFVDKKDKTYNHATISTLTVVSL